VVEGGSIVYKKDGVNERAVILSPWLKLNYYGVSRLPDHYGFKIPLNLGNDEERHFYDLLSVIDKVTDNEDDKYIPIIQKSIYPDSNRPDYLLTQFKYSRIENRIRSRFYFSNNNVRTEINVQTKDDILEYFQKDCEFRVIMNITYLCEGFNNKYFLKIYLDCVEVKTDRTSLSRSIFFDDSDDDSERLINLANLHTLPLKGVIKVKLGSGILLIDDNPEYPDKPSSECPISRENFVNNEDVIIFNRAQYGFKHMYKLTSLQAWINHKPTAPTDPTTREPITKQNVERYKLQFM